MKLSIIIPAYNEAESLPELLAEIDREREQSLAGFTSLLVLLVDDGSTDQTAIVIRQLSQRYPFVRGVFLLRNYGKALALMAGFDQLQGTSGLVATLDGDLQDVPAELARLRDQLEKGFDLVVGWKRRRHDPLSKRIPSRVANGAMKLFTGIKIHDMNCGLKLMRSEVAASLKLYGDLHRFIPALAAANGFKVGEVAVEHRARKWGVTKYGAGRLLRSVFDFLTILMITKFSYRPLHFFGPIGLLSFLAGLTGTLYLTTLRLLGESIGTRPLLLFSVLLIIFGVQTLSIGLVSELIVAQGRFRRYSLRS